MKITYRVIVRLQVLDELTVSIQTRLKITLRHGSPNFDKNVYVVYSANTNNPTVVGNNILWYSRNNSHTLNIKI